LHADALQCELPVSDVFVMNDILHYLLPEEQEQLIKRAIMSLNSGGFLILRDGDSEKVSNHRVTKISEWFSIKLLRFNKANQAPCFTSGTRMREISLKLNCDLTEKLNDKVTSNTIYILRPKQNKI